MIFENKEKKPFKDLTREEQLLIVAAFTACDPEKHGYVEVFPSNAMNKWYKAHLNEINVDRIYRITEIPRIPDEANWDHVGDFINAIARDEDGAVFGYTGRPEISELKFQDKGFWKIEEGDFSLLNPNGNKILASYKQGNLPWDESVIIRPGYEE